MDPPSAAGIAPAATVAAPANTDIATPPTDQPPALSSSSTAAVAAPTLAPPAPPQPNLNPENPQPPPQPAVQNPQSSLGRERPIQPVFNHSVASPNAASSSAASVPRAVSSIVPPSPPMSLAHPGSMVFGKPVTLGSTQPTGGTLLAFPATPPFGPGYSRTAPAPASISEFASSQVRLSPVAQTIGIIGTARGASGSQPQRSVQPTIMSHNHGSLRGTTIATPSSLSSATSHGSSIAPQPWMPGQGRQVQASGQSSFKPQTRPQSIVNHRAPSPQVMHSVSTSSHSQMPPAPQQQQSHMRPQPTSEQYSQQLPPARVPQGGFSQPQQPVRAPILSNQRTVTVNGQPGMLPANHPTIVGTGSPDDGIHILSKRSIHELVAQIDPSEKLDPEVEDVLIDIAEDFVESITAVACSLAKHRKSTTLESKDILLHLERNWNMTLPGFGGDEIKSYKKPVLTLLASDIHRERLTAIKKSAAVSESGVLKNTSAHVSANAKGHLGKASTVGLDKS